MKYAQIYQPDERRPFGSVCWCYKCRTRIALVESCVNPSSNICIICLLKENLNIDRIAAVRYEFNYRHEKPLAILARREEYHEELREALRQRWQYKFKEWIKNLVRKMKRWILR